ncbi:hypothetical protein EMPG_10048 [Blastomyces silverae]|uniref:Retrotransposon gag domain-containing protein n=1 Tax=Blastomyces silverae TaxID=2060906 RepID=A0A0H1B585_9EURO|nr:hypothetical protein EMPG_10048 [Blastomyces silverae]
MASLFRHCGKFSGENGQSLNRWLRKLEWELRFVKIDGKVPSDQLLAAIDVLLTGEAEEWLQANPNLCQLLERPTEEGEKIFLEALRDQFPEQPVKKVSCETELAKLVQEDKDLAEYYQAGVKTLRRLGIKDQAATSSVMSREPDILLLEMVVYRWIRGLTKTRTRTKLIEVSSDLPTLQAAYNKARNVEEAERELKKDKESREREKEIAWLRKCMRKSLDPSKYTEFRAAATKQVQGVEEEEE